MLRGPRQLERLVVRHGEAAGGREQECNKALWRVIVIGATSSCFKKMALAPVESELRGTK